LPYPSHTPPHETADIFEFYRRSAEANPDPQTELEFGNTYQLLVAVTLSAQATDVGVNK
jgi:endonuclease-3